MGARVLDATIPSSAVLLDGRVLEVASAAELEALREACPEGTTIVDLRGFEGASWPRTIVVGALLGIASCDAAPRRIAPPPATLRERALLCHAGELGGAWIAHGRLGPRASARLAGRDSRGRLAALAVEGEVLVRCEWDDQPVRALDDAQLRRLREPEEGLGSFLVATYDPRS